MNWFSRVRNSIPFIARQDSTPDNLWHKCKACGEMVFAKEFEDNLSVCPKCNHHDRIGAAERFAMLFDDQIWEELASPTVREDPLKFRDSKKYAPMSSSPPPAARGCRKAYCR